MRKVLIAVLLGSALAWAAEVTCPLHPGAACYDTGQIAPASGAHKYHCSCGDDVWVGD